MELVTTRMVSFLLSSGVLLIGILIGFWISGTRHKRNCAGVLREDRSDPDEAPYLFLELSQEGFNMIQTHKYVTFKVLRENYIPRK